MFDITQQDINAVKERIPALWESVAKAVSEAIGTEAKIVPGEPEKLAVNDVLQQGEEAGLSVQFGLTNPETNGQLIFFTAQTVEALGKALIEGELPDDVENIVPEVRPMLEAIVQGICAGVGARAEQSMIACDLAIRFHSLALSPALENERQLYAVPISIGIGSESFEAKWFFDYRTGAIFVKPPTEGDEEGGTDAPFEQLDGNPSLLATTSDASFERLLDIPLEISVELGRVKMLVSDVVELGSGSVIEVEKSAGEPVDVLVNGRLVARGEVVVIEDNFGVRITEILSRQDRLNRLNDVA